MYVQNNFIAGLYTDMEMLIVDQIVAQIFNLCSEQMGVLSLHTFRAGERGGGPGLKLCGGPL